MKFLLEFVHDNYKAVIVSAVILFLSALSIIVFSASQYITDDFTQYADKQKYGDILYYDGDIVSGSMATSVAKEHYKDGYTIMVDTVTVSAANVNTLGLKDNAKYLCTITQTDNVITKVLFTKQ